MRWFPILLLAASLLVGCPTVEPDPEPVDDDDTTPDPGPSPYSLDDVLTLSHVQAKGTHNSYHQQPDPVWHSTHRYTHDPLDVQLAEHGVRQFELDVHYREGAGFQVFHLPSVDAETSCLQLTDCLETIKAWSTDNPWHLPIMIWLEPKDEDLDGLEEDLLELLGRWDDLEDTIESVLPRSRIVTPDDVRRDHATLPDAIVAEGFPTLGTMRGKVVFSLLDSGSRRDDYVAGNETLEGRLLFANGSPEDPWGAMFKMNDGSDPAVAERVAAGFVVTSNAGQAPDGDPEGWDAALAGGPNFVSTDFPGERDDGWFAVLPDGVPARCNPVSAPPECTAAEVESLP